jgi:hypothetical protein
MKRAVLRISSILWRCEIIRVILPYQILVPTVLYFKPEEACCHRRHIPFSRFLRALALDEQLSWLLVLTYFCRIDLKGSPGFVESIYLLIYQGRFETGKIHSFT